MARRPIKVITSRPIRLQVQDHRDRERNAEMMARDKTPQRITRKRGDYTPAPMPKDEDINAVLAQIRRNRLTVPET